MTRFRKHLAVMPFVIVFVVPVALLAVYFVHRHHAATPAETPAATVCIEASPAIAGNADECEQDEAQTTR